MLHLVEPVGAGRHGGRFGGEAERKCFKHAALEGMQLAGRNLVPPDGVWLGMEGAHVLTKRRATAGDSSIGLRGMA